MGETGVSWFWPARRPRPGGAGGDEGEKVESQGAILSASSPRLGHKKAIVAVAAAMLRIAYPMLKDGTFHQDLGPDYRGHKNPHRAAQNLAKRIRALGFEVDLKMAA